MTHFLATIVPLQFCYQLYGLLIISCLLCGIALLGMALSTLYGMGGKELCCTLSFICLYSIARLCIPPWDETRNALFQSYKKTPKTLAVEHFTLEEKEELIHTPCCPICLCSFEAGNKLSMGRACGHVFHQECLSMWLPKSTTCPMCRQDLIQSCPEEESSTNKAGGWGSLGGIFESVYT